MEIINKTSVVVPGSIVDEDNLKGRVFVGRRTDWGKNYLLFMTPEGNLYAFHDGTASVYLQPKDVIVERKANVDVVISGETSMPIYEE